MSEVLEFYQQQAQQGRSTLPWLADLQAEGLRELTDYGFPTRRHEEWKYTLLDSFLQQRFSLQGAEAGSQALVPSSLPLGLQLNIQNGQVRGINQLTKHLPKGMIVQALAQALEEHADKLKPYLGKALKSSHGFQALNTALLHAGVFIYLPKGACLDEPLVLSHWQDQANQVIHNRYLIVAEEGSQATIIEEYHGAEACNYFTNTITEVFTAAGAKLVHYKIQREGRSAYHIGHLAVRQAQASQFDSHSLNLGGKLVRSDIEIDLEEEQARCLMNGIYAPAEGQHVDHHTNVKHLVPSCQSEQDYKGVLKGRSHAVFNGKVFVAKGAQHTKAQQQNKNLLLSSQAEIDTKPQLEIFANDVICTHGATVGQLDEEALFYLATRGISKEEANSYLIHAFAADNLRLIPNPKLAEWMAGLLNEQLR